MEFRKSIWDKHSDQHVVWLSYKSLDQCQGIFHSTHHCALPVSGCYIIDGPHGMLGPGLGKYKPPTIYSLL